MFTKKVAAITDYTLGETLGTGSFATVRVGTDAKGGKFAVKCIEKGALSKEDLTAILREVEILGKVSHPNIVNLMAVYDTPKTFYLVMDLMTGGELFDRIVQKERYTEGEAAGVMKKLASALVYCHGQGIVHRDLKPENVLYKDETDAAEIKIADFGLAKIMQANDMMSTQCGTPGYVSPETLSGNPYTEKVDIWSLGVILYILLCGFPPFYDENNAVLFEQIRTASYDFPSPYWDGVSKQAKELITRLLVVDPADRLSAQQVLEHPWISNNSTVSINVSGNIRRFQARKKFREGVLKIQAMQKFAKMGKIHAESWRV